MAECRVCRRMMTDWPGQGSVACEPCLINEMSADLTTLRQRAEAAEKILGDIEEAIGADRRSDHTMLPGIVKDTHAIMLERSDALAATEQEKARLVSAMTAESERLAKRVAELEGLVGEVLKDPPVNHCADYGDWCHFCAARPKKVRPFVDCNDYETKHTPDCWVVRAKAAIDAAGGQHD